MFQFLMVQKQHCDKQEHDHPGACLDLLQIAAENTDDDIGDQTKGDAIGDVVGKGYDRKGGNAGTEILKSFQSIFLMEPIIRIPT